MAPALSIIVVSPAAGCEGPRLQPVAAPGRAARDPCPQMAGARSLPGLVCTAGSFPEGSRPRPVLAAPAGTLVCASGARDPGGQRTRPEGPVLSPPARWLHPRAGCPEVLGLHGITKTAFVFLAIVLPTFPTKVSGTSDASGSECCRSWAPRCAWGGSSLTGRSPQGLEDRVFGLASPHWG